MSDQNQVTPFVWGEISLSQTVFVNGAPHGTRYAIGEFLDYADPQKAVDNILARNPHIEAWSVPLKLRGTDGKNYETFVYHPIGFMLIVFESGQPRAHEMKQAVAEFVWHYAKPKQLSIKEQIELQKLERALYNDIGRTKDKFAATGLISMLSNVCFTLGKPLPDLAFLGQQVDQPTLPGL